MNKKTKFSVTFALTFFFLCFMISAGEPDYKNPLLISPGIERGVAKVDQSCPTFSWSGVERASGYRIAVFEAVYTDVLTYEEMQSMASPVLIKEIKGRALSWTPSSDERLSNGSMYVWYVQAVDASGLGTWSEGLMFKVELEVRFAGIEEKLKETLKGYGMKEDIIKKVLKDL